MTVVFRVENADHEGPYRIEDLHPVLENHNTNPRTPTPLKDGINIFDLWPQYPQDDLLFAFENLESLYRWFTEEERNEIKKFCRVSIILTNQMHAGWNQVVFAKNTAKRIGTFSLGYNLKSAKKRVAHLTKEMDVL